MKTYYIVRHVNADGATYWMAYPRGILSTFNTFSALNSIVDTMTFGGADVCEDKLRRVVSPVKPVVVRVLKL